MAASAFLEGYAWTLARPLFATLAGGRPAPDLAAANVGLRFDGGLLAEVAVDDPARPAGGAAGAAARMVDDHLGPLAARLAERRVRRGPRALSGLVVNGCAAALLEEAGRPACRPRRPGGCWPASSGRWPRRCRRRPCSGSAPATGPGWPAGACRPWPSAPAVDGDRHGRLACRSVRGPAAT